MSTEQVSLKGGEEADASAAPSSEEAGGATAEDADSDQISAMETGIRTSKIDTEHISFDFFVNIEIGAVTNEKIVQVMSKSLETEESQIEDVKLTEAGTQKRALTRISGKVHCDEWEMKILTDKFNRLIPDRILSQNIMDVLGLEDRPRVSRFFSRASTIGSSTGLGLGGTQTSGASSSKGGSTNPGDKLKLYPKDDEQRTNSLRMEHKAEGGSGLGVDQSQVRPAPAEGEDPAAPSGGGCCLVM